jgi:hypothetical protein
MYTMYDERPFKIKNVWQRGNTTRQHDQKSRPLQLITTVNLIRAAQFLSYVSCGWSGLDIILYYCRCVAYP